MTDESNMVLGSTLDTAHAANVDSIHIPGSIQTVTAVVTDVYIAIALTIILRRKRTGFHACVLFLSVDFDSIASRITVLSSSR